MTVTVDYATADGSALAGADYTAAAGTLTFSPGDTSRTISVAVLDDGLDEADESFRVALSNPVNATVDGDSARITIVDNESTVYLPAILNQQLMGPDLIVQQIVSGGQLGIVIVNQGNAAVLQPFWVDVYVNPSPAPQQTNQIWPLLSAHGATWGVTGAALPLDPGETLVLTVGDGYYAPDLSNLPETLSAGTVLYAQVDSANVATSYGGVLELHEILGGPYNNVLGPVVLNDAIQPVAVTTPGGAASYHLLPVR
ncbi:MAG: Calx-beta domain-containing protein [Caldilineaceae bacterium]